MVIHQKSANSSPLSKIRVHFEISTSMRQLAGLYDQQFLNASSQKQFLIKITQIRNTIHWYYSYLRNFHKFKSNDAIQPQLKQQ